MARRCLNTEAQRHRARSCTVPDASRVAGAGKVRLGDVCSFSKGQQINGKELSDSYDYPFINGGVSPSGNWKDYNVEKGAITISEGGNSCGFVNYFEVPFWCGAHCYYFYELKLEPKYFYYALKANEERLMGLRSGICMPNIRKGDLDEFEFCIDWDKATQQRIADELDRLCALKKNAEDRLAILDQIVKSRFVEMFGDPVQNNRGWPLAHLQELATKIGSGATPKGGKSSYAESGVSFIRSMNVHDARFKYDDLAYLTDSQAKELSNVEVRSLDVLLNITGASVARSCVVPYDVLPARVNQHVAIVRPVQDKLDSYFLNAMFISGSYKRLLLNLGDSNGATRQAITKGQIENLALPLPPIGEQRKFAAFMAEVDKSELTLRETVATLDQLYRAKLQEYFG